MVLVTVRLAWGKKSSVYVVPTLAHLRNGNPWTWPLPESIEPHPRPDTAYGTPHTLMLKILPRLTPEGTFKVFPTLFHLSQDPAL